MESRLDKMGGFQPNVRSLWIVEHADPNAWIRDDNKSPPATKSVEAVPLLFAR
jgi:hypothetical protein